MRRYTERLVPLPSFSNDNMTMYQNNNALYAIRRRSPSTVDILYMEKDIPTYVYLTMDTKRIIVG